MSSKAEELHIWLQRIEGFHPKEIELGLERVHKLASDIDCLSFSCPVVSVAGTNGKGSCVELITTLALKHGLSVGTYTSPHLFKFNERIRINGLPVSDEQLIKSFEFLEKHRQQALSFFEFTTLSALKIFKDNNLDLIVLEVGLGGRLDAVNIIDAEVSVITSVGLDHEAWLGNTRSKIAIEKAGIARKGKVCVVGDPEPPSSLAAELSVREAIAVQVNRDFHGEFVSSGTQFNMKILEGDKPSVHFSLDCSKLKLSPWNCLIAIQSFYALFHARDLAIDVQKVYSACYEASLIGRFQLVHCTPRNSALSSTTLICDLTHNPAGAQFFTEQLSRFLQTHRFNRVSALCGFMADKDIKGILQEFTQYIDVCLLTDLAPSRAEKANTIVESRLPEHFVPCKVFSSPELALDDYLSDVGEGELLLVFGSFYLLEPVLKYLKSTCEPWS